MSGAFGNELKSVMKETFETVWSFNLQNIKIIKKTNINSGNMFYGDFDKGEKEYVIKANLFAPDYSKATRDFNLNTINYTYTAYTRPDTYPTADFIIENKDIVEYNGKRYEIQDLNSQQELSAAQTLTQNGIIWQSFNMKLIE